MAEGGREGEALVISLTIFQGDEDNRTLLSFFVRVPQGKNHLKTRKRFPSWKWSMWCISWVDIRKHLFTPKK